MIYKKMGNLAQAEHMVLQALRLMPGKVHYLVEYASILTIGGQRQKAQKVIAWAKQLEPENRQVDNLDAYYTDFRGDSKKALAIVSRNLQDNPENSKSQQFFGVLQLKQGHIDTGHRHLASAAHLSGGAKVASAAAREAKIYAHWTLYPLRLIYHFDSTLILIGLIAAVFALLELNLSPSATWLIRTYIAFAIYRGIGPALVGIWFHRQNGPIN